MRTTYLLLLLATIHGTAAQRAVDDAIEESEQRIFYGDDSDKGEFPFMVRILSPDGGHTCGGSLINKRIVLTAAHCLIDPDTGKVAENTEVVLGDHSSEVTEDTEVTIKSIRSIIHPDYIHESNDIKGDIALLVLENEAQEGKGVGVIALPADRKLYAAGTPVTIIGWGLTESEDLSEVLQKHVYEVSDQQLCAEYWTTRQMTVQEGSICTGKVPKEGWAFSGDSGGPVVAQDNGKFVLIGATSWGDWLPSDASYDVGMDIQFYKKWIDENMKQGVGNQWIELQGGFRHGLVVFHDNSEIYTACSHMAGPNEVDAICKHMGFKQGVPTSAAMFFYRGRKQEPATFPPMARTSIECDAGTDDVWNKCRMKKYPEEATVPCFTGQQLAVQCFMTEWAFNVPYIDVRLKEKGTTVKGKVSCAVSAFQYGVSVDVKSEVQMSVVNVEGTNVDYVVEDMKYKRKSTMFMGRVRPQDGVKHNCFVCVASLRGSKKFFAAKVQVEGCKMDSKEALAAVNSWMESNQKPAN